MSNQRHICEFAEVDGGGDILEKNIFYEDTNQTEIFTGVKTKNDIYYRGKKHY